MPDMFQFTDDDDPDVEGILDLPLEKSSYKAELDSTKCSKSDNLKDILDDYDDNELILSMMDNVDSTIIDQTLPKDSLNITQSESFDSVPAGHNTSQKSPKQSSNNVYITTSNVKHKLTVVEPSTSKAPRVEYERKFPGPAGLIPKKSKFTTPVKYQVVPDGSPIQADIPPVKNDFIFENGCWDKLIKDIETISPRLLTIIDENTVTSVRRMNIIRNKPRKLRFFAALIVNIDCSVCDPSVLLKDSTGEIHGTLHKELWEAHGELLTVGTALLMKQVSVLSITNSRKLYVNVTINNIVKLYTPQSGGPVLVTELTTISQQDLVPQISNNERLVFVETHPNIPKTLKEVPTRKPSLPSVSKTDRIKTTVKENTAQKVQFKINPDTLVHSGKSTENQPSNEIIFGELDGIDADSLFGDF